MRTRLKFPTAAGILCAAVALVAATGDSVGDVRALYDGKLRPDVQVNTFRHIDRVFPSRTVARGSSISPLPPSSDSLTDVEFTSGNRKHDLAEYLSLNRVSGLLVLKDGKVALEDYELGNTAEDRWVSWSMVKSISSTLVGAAIKDGYISSLDDPLTKYLPELAGSAYDGAREMERNLYRPQIRPPAHARPADCAEARRHPPVPGYPAARRRTRHGLEL
jgi:hypothetical protein